MALVASQSEGLAAPALARPGDPADWPRNQPPSESPPGGDLPSPLRRGLILQDLTFVHLGNPDYIDGKVNFSKRWQQFNILDSMRCFQQA